LGDVVVRAKYWLLTTENSDRNVGVSFGVKLPTGKADLTANYFGRQVPVDVSVQPGDNSRAGTTGIYGFQQVGRVTLFGYGSYLSNPRNTTGVPAVPNLAYRMEGVPVKDLFGPSDGFRQPGVKKPIRFSEGTRLVVPSGLVFQTKT
jgi:hypothetical protein